MSWDAGHARRELLALAVQHNVEVEWVASIEEAEAGIGRVRLAWLPRPKTPTKFLVALHELGHVIDPGARGTSLVAEARAWEWAVAHVPEWAKPHVGTHELGCVGSYLASHALWPLAHPAEDMS